MIRDIIVSAFLVYVLAFILPGIHITGLGGAFIAAIVMVLVNRWFKPILVILTLPITFYTLGIFYLILNALCTLLVSHIVHDFEVRSFPSAFVFSCIYSFIMLLVRAND